MGDESVYVNERENPRWNWWKFLSLLSLIRVESLARYREVKEVSGVEEGVISWAHGPKTSGEFSLWSRLGRFP